MLALAAALLIAAQPPVVEQTVSPPPTELVAVTESGEVCVLSVAHDGAITRVSDPTPITWPEGHSGRHISDLHAHGHWHAGFDRRTNTIMLLSTDASEVHAVARSSADATVLRRGLTVTPAGATIVLDAATNALQVMPNEWWTDDSAEGVPLVGLTGIGALEALAHAPDGTLYAVGNEQGTRSSRVLYTISLNTGEATKVADLPVRDLDALVFADDGYLYATDANGADAHLFLIDPVDGATTDLGAVGVVGITALARRVPPLFEGCG